MNNLDKKKLRYYCIRLIESGKLIDAEQKVYDQYLGTLMRLYGKKKMIEMVGQLQKEEIQKDYRVEN